MARGNSTANNASIANANQASSAFGSLNPFLTSEMVNPPGFSPEAIAKMNTGAQQEAGGAVAAAVGQGALRSARTRNRGGSDAATAASTRAASETLSKGMLGVQNANEQLKARQQQEGAQGLENIFGVSTGAVAPDINASTNAEDASWDWAKDIFTPIVTAGEQGAGAAYGNGKGCWIAEAIYGIDDPRTHLVRAWLNGPFRESWTGRSVMSLYLAVGQQVAWLVRRSSILRTALTPLFAAALRRAQASGNVISGSD